MTEEAAAQLTAFPALSRRCSWLQLGSVYCLCPAGVASISELSATFEMEADGEATYRSFYCSIGDACPQNLDNLFIGRKINPESGLNAFLSLSKLFFFIRLSSARLE